MFAVPLLPNSVTSAPTDVSPVPPLATPKVPVTPVVSGSPVQLVSTPDVGVPRSGVVSVGEVAKTKSPVPVSFVTAAARLALVAVPKKVAMFAANPETPVLIGRPVQLVSVPLDGVPSAGVTRVGEVANTRAPLPVSFVTAAARFALDGVASQVAMPVPSPDTPVLIGNPVQLVNVPLVGVPSTGVTSVGDVERTTVEPVPVVDAAVSAPPDAPNTVAVTVVARAMAGVVVGFVIVKSKPFPSVPDTLVTVPPPVA